MQVISLSACFGDRETARDEALGGLASGEEGANIGAHGAGRIVWQRHEQRLLIIGIGDGLACGEVGANVANGLHGRDQDGGGDIEAEGHGGGERGG